MTGKKKLVGIYLTIETLKNLRKYCAEKFLTLSEVVERAVKEYLKKDIDRGEK